MLQVFLHIGYNRKKIVDDKGYTLEENQAEAIIVKQIFNMYAYENLSIAGIVRELSKSGNKPRIADEWSKSTIKDMLRNPVYIGKIRWNNRKTVKILKNREIQSTRPRNDDPLIVDGLHSPIIEQETWDITQERLKGNKAPVQHNNIVKNPLLHILICEKCGGYMQRRPYNKKGKEATLMCTKCDNISSKFHYVEDKIIEGLKYWLKEYEVDYDKVRKSKNTKNINYYENSISQLQIQIDNEKKQIDKVCDAFEKGVYSDETYKERYQKHKDIIAKYETTISEYREQLEKEYSVLNQKKLMVPKLENVIDVYYKLENPEEKNDLLKTIIEKVTYLKEKPALKKNDDPTDFTIRIYPKLPK